MTTKHANSNTTPHTPSLLTEMELIMVRCPSKFYEQKHYYYSSYVKQKTQNPVYKDGSDPTCKKSPSGHFHFFMLSALQTWAMCFGTFNYQLTTDFKQDLNSMV